MKRVHQRDPALRRVLRAVAYDPVPAYAQPANVVVVIAGLAAVVGSLVADIVLVKLGVKVFPTTQGYVHFQFHDYAKLTVLGVVVACLGWLIVTRFTSAPRWLFLRLAVLVTFVLWLPDLWILHKGQPVKAVAILMLMHLAVAVVTYTALTRIAKVGMVRVDVGEILGVRQSSPSAPTVGNRAEVTVNRPTEALAIPKVTEFGR